MSVDEWIDDKRHKKRGSRAEIRGNRKAMMICQQINELEKMINIQKTKEHQKIDRYIRIRDNNGDKNNDEVTQRDSSQLVSGHTHTARTR